MPIDNRITKLKQKLIDLKKEQKLQTDERGIMEQMMTTRDEDFDKRKQRLEKMQKGM